MVQADASFAARTAPGDLPQLCELAAERAALETGVPLSVLQAISLNETGRKRGDTMEPWPWTVNMEGRGKWFDTKDKAHRYVLENYQRGARSFDVGCFQINFKWHGKAFDSIREMFDPLSNALYAAKFLKTLFEETGDWSAAAGAYHSRTKKFADRYKRRFDSFRARLQNKIEKPGVSKAPVAVRLASREGRAEQVRATGPLNQYPLLQGRIGGSTLGSLVPLAPGARRLIDLQAGVRE